MSSVAAATDWSAVGAWASWATVLIYIVLGVFAWVQVSDARKVREEQSRPFVIVDFEPDFLVQFTVENLGKTMARNVVIKFDRDLESTLPGTREIDMSPLFRKPIPAFPPGKKISLLFDSFPNRIDAELPLAYEVTVTYQGPTGSKTYKETYTLDLEMYLGARMPPKGISELVEEVQAMREEMNKWRGHELRGLLVHTVSKEDEGKANQRKLNAYILQREGHLGLMRARFKKALARFGFS